MIRKNWIWNALMAIPLLLLSCSDDAGLLSTDNNPSAEPNNAHEITIDDARDELLTILDDVYGTTSRSSHSMTIKEEYTRPLSCSKSRGVNETELNIHIFNFEDNQGFAIMSGDDRVPTLLALSNCGNFYDGAELDNPGLSLFMDGADTIPNDCTRLTDIWAKEGDIDLRTLLKNGGYIRYSDWRNIIYKSNGYCDVDWGQDAPYNWLCPIVNGEYTKTCCVATAVAQLMSTYKYPENYQDKTFEWDEMTAHRKADECSLSATYCIATLMAELGTENNLDVSYDINDSYAARQNVPRTLQAFGYSQPGTIIEYNIDEIISEISEGHSLLIGGNTGYKTIHVNGEWRNVYTGGHSWLIHGLLKRSRELFYYDENDKPTGCSTETYYYPLCNWGWNGQHNGYFLSDAFDALKGKVYEVSGEPNYTQDNTDNRNYKYNITLTTKIRI